MSVTGVEMSYGNYDLKPAPLITVGREVFKQPNGEVIGGGYRVSLNGSLIPALIVGTGLTAEQQEDSEGPHSLNANAVRIEGHQFDGSNNAMTVFRAKNDFLHAFNQDHMLFRTRFLGDGPLCRGYPIYGAPRVVSVEFSSEDQWTHKLDYTVELFFNNSISTGTGAPGFSVANAVARGDGYGGGGALSSYTGIMWSQSGAFDYIAGDLQSYSREYNVETLSKGAQIGSGYMPSFFQVNVTTSAQVMEGTRSDSANPKYPQSFGAPYSGVRPTLDSNAGVTSFVRMASDLPPIKLQGSGSLTEVMSGYLGATPVSGFSGIHTDSSYSYNKGDGTYNYNDTFVLYGTTGSLAAKGFNLEHYPVMDTPTLDVEGSLENAIVTVTLQGELKGFSPYFGDSSGTVVDGLGPFGDGLKLSEALANAQRYLDEAAYFGSVKGRHTAKSGLFYNRVSNAYSGLNFPAVQLLPLQPEPIAQSISYNTRESTIGYSFTYNNRPPNCFSGALHETINISRGNPSEVHSNLTILGRAKGPILQDIATITASTTEVNVEAVIVPDSGTGLCTGNIFVGYRTAHTRDFYSGLLVDVESGISGEYGTYFVTSDNETYDPKTGRYSRSKAWIHSLC